MGKDLKKFKFSELPADQKLLEEPPLHGELDVEQLVFRQIERTNQSALEDEALFASNIRTLLSMVPSHKRSEIYERTDEFTSIQKNLEYKYWCGVPLGTPEHPVNGSPALVEEEVIDWHKLYEIILDVLEECGLTWKFDKWTIEVGAVEEKAKALAAPMFNNRYRREETEDGKTVLKHTRKCAICRKHVEPFTGRYYRAAQWKHSKVVHKVGCYDLAIARWGVPVE